MSFAGSRLFFPENGGRNKKRRSVIILSPNGTKDFAGQFVVHVRYCFVDTKLIDGDDRAKNQFSGVGVATEVKRQFSFSFAFQISSFQSTGSTKFGVSAITEVEHHVLSDSIPFTIRLVRVSSVPFLF